MDDSTPSAVAVPPQLREELERKEIEASIANYNSIPQIIYGTILFQDRAK